MSDFVTNDSRHHGHNNQRCLCADQLGQTQMTHAAVIMKTITLLIKFRLIQHDNRHLLAGRLRFCLLLHGGIQLELAIGAQGRL